MMNVIKLALIVTTSSLLVGCFNDTDDLQAYVNEIKSTVSGKIEEMEPLTEFHHFDYQESDRRSPFVEPKPEAIVAKLQQTSNCLAPDPRRRKQPLEKFATDTLKMRGTIGELGIVWALIEASDGTLHRLTTGHYLGLYHGRVTNVNKEKINIMELIPDGAGCWTERETSIEMKEPE